MPDRLPLVVGYTEKESLTAGMVAKVSSGWVKNMVQYESWFDDIDLCVLSGWQAIQKFDLERLGELIDENHRLLNALEVMGRDQNQMVEIAGESGALGAKMTGDGAATESRCGPFLGQIVAAAIRVRVRLRLKPPTADCGRSWE